MYSHVRSIHMRFIAMPGVCSPRWHAFFYSKMHRTLNWNGDSLNATGQIRFFFHSHCAARISLRSERALLPSAHVIKTESIKKQLSFVDSISFFFSIYKRTRKSNFECNFLALIGHGPVSLSPFLSRFDDWTWYTWSRIHAQHSAQSSVFLHSCVLM